MNKLVKDNTLSRQAYRALCDLIRQMEPGENRLPSEDELARSMGVSRATVREALKHLMLDGVITTIHGKGTYAHPSIFHLRNRIDLYSDFIQMLSMQYDDVSVEFEWMGYTTPGEFYKKCFGADSKRVFASGWLFRANQKPMLYGYYEFCPDYLTGEPRASENVTSLPQFSGKYMKAPIDYCTMTARMGKNSMAQKQLGLHSSQYLLYWDEKIYDIDDHLTATGTVYIHPDNMELSVVARFTI